MSTAKCIYLSKIAIVSLCRGVADEPAGQGVTLGRAWRRAQWALGLERRRIDLDRPGYTIGLGLDRQLAALACPSQLRPQLPQLSWFEYRYRTYLLQVTDRGVIPLCGILAYISAMQFYKSPSIIHQWFGSNQSNVSQSSSCPTASRAIARGRYTLPVFTGRVNTGVILDIRPASRK